MLTELQCRSAKPREKAYKLADSRGLYLFVSPTGYRSFRWKYRFQRKERTLVLGAWPELSLREARERRDAAAKALHDGADPANRKAAAAAAPAGPPFEEYARAWHADQATLWKPNHAEQVMSRLEANVFPAIGAMPIADVKPRDVKHMLLAIQDRGSIAIAHRVCGRVSAIFKRAIADELVEIDPAAAVAAVLKPVKTRRFPAIVDLHRARALLRAIESDPAEPAVKLASRFLALTAARPGVIRFTPKSEEFVNLDGAAPLWHIPAERMKLGLDASEQEAFDFLVPLSRQAVDTIQAAQRAAGRSPWLFPGARHVHRPISENALGCLYNRNPMARGKHVPHGWRSTFSTIMNELAALEERLGDEDVIEIMLAHKPKGVRGIYNRAVYLRRRREIAQEWADLLLEGMPPAESLLEGPRH